MGLQLTLAGRYLWGRKLRTVLTTLAIIFGVLVVFGMNLLIPSMMAAFQANVLAASGQVDVTVTQKAGEAFAQSTVNKVKGVPGVRAAAGSLSRTINVPANFYGRTVNIDVLNLVGVEPRAAQQLRDYPIVDGRFLHAEDADAAVITTSLAKQASLRVGNALKLPTTVGVVKLTVVGLLPERTLPGNEEVMVSLLEAQKLLDLSGRINTVDANLDTTDQAQRDAIAQEITSRLGPDYRLGGLSSGSELLASIQTGQAAFNLLGILALFMGGFIIFNTFRTVIAERRHDIGMLRAVGASRGTIVGMLLAEGLLQGCVGTALGLALGYAFGAGLLLLVGTSMEQYLHLKMGGPVIEPSLVVGCIALGVGTTMLAGLLPAFNASRVTPLEALRPAATAVERRRLSRGNVVGIAMLAFAVLALPTRSVPLVMLGGLFCLIGLALVAPALVRPLAGIFGNLGARMVPDGTAALAEGNLTRQPSRAAITASTTMIGLAIIVATMGLVSSLTGGLYSLTQRTLGSDFMLMPPSVGVWASDVGASAGLAERLRAERGVGVVSSLRFAISSISGAAAKGAAGGESGVSLLGIDPETYPRISEMNFSQGDAGTAYAGLASGRAVIVNGILAAQLNLGVGDTLNLSTPEGQKAYRIVGVASDLLNAKVITAYISQAAMQADFHKTEDVFIQLNLAPGANRDSVESRLKTILVDYPQFRLVSGQAYFDELRQQMEMVFYLLYVMLAALAFPSLIAILNTLAIGIIERTREIGMLRAIGATRGQVRRTILLEALLLSAVGTAFGLLGGLYLGYIMVLGLNASGIFPMTYAFPLAGVLAAIAVGLIFGVIAALLPARQAAGLEIVRALRYE
ncbi:MAG: ABC transporter permease [Chloroflexota bacterium]